MALTYTPEPQIDQPCPHFKLTGMDHKNYQLSDFSKSEILVFLFICNHCPYVKAIEDRIIALAEKYKDQPRVQLIGVCSNDPSSHPEDSFESLQSRWREKNYGFPYLHDPTQVMAKSFEAVCTPDIFVYHKKKLAYRGRFDDSWKDSQKVQRPELDLAIQSLLNATPLNFEPVPSMGCSIKWIESHVTLHDHT